MTTGKRIVLQTGIFLMFFSLLSIGAFADNGGSPVSAVLFGLVGALRKDTHMISNK